LINIAILGYRALLRLWPVEQLADGPTGCGEVARVGCSFAWNFQSDKTNCAYGHGENTQGQS